MLKYKYGLWEAQAAESQNNAASSGWILTSETTEEKEQDKINRKPLCVPDTFIRLLGCAWRPQVVYHAWNDKTLLLKRLRTRTHTVKFESFLCIIVSWWKHLMINWTSHTNVDSRLWCQVLSSSLHTRHSFHTLQTTAKCTIVTHVCCWPWHKCFHSKCYPTCWLL